MITVIRWIENNPPNRKVNSKPLANSIISRTLGTPVVMDRDWIKQARKHKRAVPKSGELWRVRLLLSKSKPTLLLCQPLSELNKKEEGGREYDLAHLVLGGFSTEFNSDRSHMYVKPNVIPDGPWILSKRYRRDIMSKNAGLRAIIVSLDPLPLEKERTPYTHTVGPALSEELKRAHKAYGKV